MKRKLITSVAVLASLLSARVNVKAQDFHLTQYDAFTMYLNPALTGNYLGQEADYRAYLNYRTQWRPLATKPYVTYGVAYDMPYKRFGLGGYLIDNRSGAMSFNTLNFQLSGSYFITDPKTSPHLLNVGLQTGLFYKSFNMNNLLFESQYDNSSGQLNPNIGSGETFTRFARTNFDANMGVFYKYTEQEKYKPFLGFSLFHLNMPYETFISNRTRLPIRFNLHGGCDVKIDEKWSVTPMFLYMNQAKAWEVNLGALGYYNLDNSKEVKYQIIFGMNVRVKDAIMLQAGCRKDNFILRMSYDINTSALKPYSSGRGGFELTLQVIGLKGQSPFKSMASF